jgi:putative NADH-flavin reductase
MKQALTRGHDVTAVARRPEAIEVKHKNLVVEPADVLDAETLVAALAGSEAVVSALGIGTSRAATVIYSEGIKNLLSAMGTNGTSTIAVISAAPVGPRAEQSFLERRLAMPILERMFGATYDDMRRMEALLLISDVDWVSLRPPRLVNKTATGTYRLDTRPLPNGRNITHVDLATALLDSLNREDLYRKAAFVAN